MERHIAGRERATGLPNPIHDQGSWHGREGIGSFESSQQAYDTLHIGSAKTAQRLQAGKKK